MDLRQRILDASVELITDEGLAALSMREVARRAGVSHQAPYHHFADREAILAAIAEDGFRRLVTAIEASEKSYADAAGRLVAGGLAYVRFAAAHPAHFRVMFRPELVNLDHHPSAEAEATRAFEALEALVQGAVDEGLVAPSLAHGMAIFAWAFVHGLSWLSIEGPLEKMRAEGRVKARPVEAAFRAYRSLLERPRKPKR